MSNEIKNLTIATSLAALLTFGGGASFIPLFHDFYINKFHFITETKFYEIYAYASALPGPLAPMMAGAVGWQISGWKGFLLAIAALAVPTLILTLAAYHYMQRFKDHPLLKNLTIYTIPLILGVLATILPDIAYECTKSLPDNKGLHLIILTLSPMLIIGRFKKNPAIAIILNIVYAIIFLK